MLQWPRLTVMELSQLKALLTLAEVASFARVGEQLHLSPSAVFCQIRQLEEETGQKMYERVGKKLHLTSAGEVLAQHARKILEAHEAALLATKEQSPTRKEMLRLGCGPHGSVRIVPYLLRALVNAHPSTEVRLITSTEDQPLVRDVRLGLLDAILMSLPVGDKELCEEPMWSYELVFTLPPVRMLRTPLSKPGELSKVPFILYSRTVVVDAVLKRLCSDLGFEPNVVMENDEADSIKELVKLGFGIALLPLWSVVDEARRGRLRVLRPKQPQLYNYGLVYRGIGYSPRVLSDLREVAHRFKDWWPYASSVAEPIP